MLSTPDRTRDTGQRQNFRLTQLCCSHHGGMSHSIQTFRQSLHRRDAALQQLSRYRLRRTTRTDHLCTSEVAARCLALAGEEHAADTLDAYLEVFTSHYMDAKRSVLPDLEDAAHLRLRTLIQSI